MAASTPPCRAPSSRKSARSPRPWRCWPSVRPRATARSRRAPRRRPRRKPTARQWPRRQTTQPTIKKRNLKLTRRTPRPSARPPRPRPSRLPALEPMAKGKVPTRDELLAFIRDSATPVGKREIARAWSLKGDQRIELKELLRELRDSGEIAADRAKTFRDPGALSDVAVLEIVRVDNDGHLIAVPLKHDETKDGPPPRI